MESSHIDDQLWGGTPPDPYAWHCYEATTSGQTEIACPSGMEILLGGDSISDSEGNIPLSSPLDFQLVGFPPASSSLSSLDNVCDESWASSYLNIESSDVFSPNVGAPSTQFDYSAFPSPDMDAISPHQTVFSDHEKTNSELGYNMPAAETNLALPTPVNMNSPVHNMQLLVNNQGAAQYLAILPSSNIPDPATCQAIPDIIQQSMPYPSPEISITNSAGSPFSPRSMGGNLACTICSATFSTRGKLNIHAKRHSKNISCPHCGRGFSWMRDKDRHVSSVHNESKKYKCPCGCSYNRKDNLRRHINYKHPESR